MHETITCTSEYAWSKLTVGSVYCLFYFSKATNAKNENSIIRNKGYSLLYPEKRMRCKNLPSSYHRLPCTVSYRPVSYATFQFKT